MATQIPNKLPGGNSSCTIIEY